MLDSSYDHHCAYRTSNMVDQLMNRWIEPVLTGSISMAILLSAERRVRMRALLWNFCSSSLPTVRKYQQFPESDKTQ